MQGRSPLTVSSPISSSATRCFIWKIFSRAWRLLTESILDTSPRIYPWGQCFNLKSQVQQLGARSRGEVCPARAYALCPMPYALCPMHVGYLMLLRKAIGASFEKYSVGGQCFWHSSISRRARIFLLFEVEWLPGSHYRRLDTNCTRPASISSINNSKAS